MEDIEDVKEEEVQLPEEPSTTKQTTEEEPKADVATEAESSETAESSKGANQRIRELNQAKKAAEADAAKARAEAVSLSKRLAEITEPIGFQGNTPQYVPQVQPGQEITPEQYSTDVAKTAAAQVDLKIAQNNATNRIRNESLDAVRKYPQLDPESDNFDQELSETVTEAVEAHVRVNPYNASVGRFVDKLMKPYQRAVATEVGKATENIAKQVSEAALRPTSVRQPEKPATEKSVAELEQELGIVNS